MEAVVEQALGDVGVVDLVPHLQAVVEDHLVHRGRVVGEVVGTGEPVAHEVGVQDRDLRHRAQTVAAEAPDVGQGAHQDEEVAVEAAHRADRGGVVPEKREGGALADHPRHRQVRQQGRRHRDRAGAGSAAAVRRREGLVEVDVHGVGAHQAGQGAADEGVEVGAVHVDEAAAIVDQARDLDDAVLEDAEGVRHRQHQRRDRVVHRPLEGREVDGAVGRRRQLERLVAREGSRRRVGAVRRVGHQHHPAGVAAGLERPPDHQHPGELAVGAGGRLQGDAGEAGDRLQGLLELPDQAQGPLHL